MARGSCLSRACALTAIVSALVAPWLRLLGGPPLSALCAKFCDRDPEVERGGGSRTAHKARSVGLLARFLSQHPAPEVGNSYDANAIGEFWGTSAMGHRVDRAGAAASAERLEAELRSMKIGCKSSTDTRRMAMQAKRVMRERELQTRRWRPENGMLHWMDRPAALESPNLLEEELTAIKIGGLAGDKGQRQAMRMRRMARMRELEGAASGKVGQDGAF
eukprot:CAMPEP_0179036670 /NCGR_PEP_ID=MMETSP0796-20121207/13735_1 /TAXON_ID=73915 /ORGANISM="Pyrodinium bahamense, Strain pbaha01" /LENGTH=218 /DNA_ID=CAMNT_0020732959 /DNA_START=69 /DNA_END=725 /DNA_ORIENTATION=+